MRVPESLVALFDYGVLDEVVRPLMSGKEAQVYLVVSSGQYAVAKIYKDAQSRSFKHRAEYTEGRTVRNSRDRRAIANRSRHGRQQDEAAWRSTEVDMIHRLHANGVRVPTPYHFIEGVLLMELVTDAEGNPAPRLGDLGFDREGARAMYDRLLRAAVQMLCAGVVHGDLSEFNVLVGADGPVVIDFPQSVDTAHNTNARKLLLRDVDNLYRFLARHDPSARRLPFAEEMWSLHERNALTPDTRLRGDFRPEQRRANTASVLAVIDDANRDERKRREALGLRGGPDEPGPRPAQGGPSRGPSRRGPRPGAPPPNRGAQPPNRGAQPPNRGAQPPNRGAQPTKEPRVYQGLPDEGLKFFRHLRDPQPGGGPRSGPPKAQGQRAQGQRPDAQQGAHHHDRRPQGGRPDAQQGAQQHDRRPQGPRPDAQQGAQQHDRRPQGPRPDAPPGRQHDPRTHAPRPDAQRGPQPHGARSHAQRPQEDRPQEQRHDPSRRRQPPAPSTQPARGSSEPPRVPRGGPSKTE